MKSLFNDFATFMAARKRLFDDLRATAIEPSDAETIMNYFFDWSGYDLLNMSGKSYPDNILLNDALETYFRLHRYTPAANEALATICMVAAIVLQ